MTGEMDDAALRDPLQGNGVPTCESCGTAMHDSLAGFRCRSCGYEQVVALPPDYRYPGDGDDIADFQPRAT